MPDSDKDAQALIRDGYTKKQVKAIMAARKKKKKTSDAMGRIQAGAAAKNKALADIENW